MLRLLDKLLCVILSVWAIRVPPDPCPDNYASRFRDASLK